MRGLPVTMSSGIVTDVTAEYRECTLDTGYGEVTGVAYHGGIPRIGDGVMVLVFGDRFLALTNVQEGLWSFEEDDSPGVVEGSSLAIQMGIGYGMSAYQIYRLLGGDIETYEDWLASLQGPAGPPGEVDYDLLRVIIQEEIHKHGTGTPHPPGTPETHIITNDAETNLAGTYSGTGTKRTDDATGRRGYYGYYSSTWGLQRSIAVLPADFIALVRAIPANGITKVTVLLNNQHTFNATGTVKVLLATETSVPATMPTVTGTEVVASLAVPKTGNATFDLPPALFEQFRTSGTGLKFTHTTTAQAGYGYLDLKSVKFTVTYEA